MIISEIARRRAEKKNLPLSASGYEPSPLVKLLLDNLMPGWEERSSPEQEARLRREVEEAASGAPSSG